MEDISNKLTIKGRFRGFLPVVVDVETAGLDPKKSALIEVAMMTVKIDENGNYTNNWESSDSIYYISVEPGKYDLKYSNLDSKGEYYCLFKIFDVKKQVHYSNLVKIN